MHKLLLCLMFIFVIVSSLFAEVDQHFCFDANFFNDIYNRVNGLRISGPPHITLPWKIDYNAIIIVTAQQDDRGRNPNRLTIYVKPYMVCEDEYAPPLWGNNGQEFGDYGRDWTWFPAIDTITLTGEIGLTGPGLDTVFSGIFFGNRGTWSQTIFDSFSYGLYTLRMKLKWHNPSFLAIPSEGSSSWKSFNFRILNPMSYDGTVDGYFLNSAIIYVETPSMRSRRGTVGYVFHPAGVFQYFVNDNPPYESDTVTVTVRWRTVGDWELGDYGSAYSYTPCFLTYLRHEVIPWDVETSCVAPSEGFPISIESKALSLNGPANRLATPTRLETHFKLCGPRLAVVASDQFAWDITLGASIPTDYLTLGGSFSFSNTSETGYVFFYPASNLTIDMPLSRIHDETISSPKDMAINVWPNPFNSIVTIEYYIPRGLPISLDICNIMGQHIPLFNGYKQSQVTHFANWTVPTDMPNGVYFVRLKVGDKVITKRAVLIR